MSSRIWIIGGAVVIVIAAGVAGWLAWDNQQQQAREAEQQRIRQSVLPCDNQDVAHSVGQAFDQSDIAKFVHLHALALSEAHETEFNFQPPKRHCAANLIAEDHSLHPVTYWVENAPNDQFTVRLAIPR